MSRAPTPSAPPAEPAAADPSMEDILASIRRILNEDEAPGPSADAASQPVTNEPATNEPAIGPSGAALAADTAPPPEEVTGAGSGGEDEDVLVLDEGMLVTPPAVPDAVALRPVLEPTPDVVFPVPVAVMPADRGPASDEGLLAPESAAAATLSVSALLRTLSNERGSQVYRGGPTIEDLVREEIRPMLKAWLDQQLPPLVERLVRQEIERVAGRAGL